MIPPRDQLPPDAGDWNSVAIDLPALQDASATCPFTDDEIMEYVRKESADLDRARSGQLQWLRTARIAGTQFWLWRFVESDGQECYVAVSRSKECPGELGIAETNGLSPEQFLLACFYDEVYWP